MRAAPDAKNDANDDNDDAASFYDQPGVAERYGAHRHNGASSANVVMEEPALLAEVGPVTGLRVVDLGCGDAALGPILLGMGCADYLGVDGSAEMVARAERTLAHTTGRVVRQRMEELTLEPGSVDLIVSRLALHYVPDVGAAFRSAHLALAAGGRLCVSVLHPLITSTDARQDPSQRRGSWTVDDYFLAGPRDREWMGETVTWQHRTIEQYVRELAAAGFTLTGLSECEPQAGRFDGDEAELARRRRIPLFLLLSAEAT